MNKGHLRVKAKGKKKKVFRHRKIPLFPLYESKRIEVNGERYTVVDQFIVPDLPLFSRFDVLDQEGNSVNDDIANKVFTYISLLLIIDHFHLLIDPLKRQKSASIDVLKDDEMILVHKQSGEMLDRLRQLMNESQNIKSESDLLRFIQQWNIFWESYRPRAELLIHFYSQKESMAKADKPTQTILDEAEIIHNLFSFPSRYEEIITLNMKELIQIYYELGRMCQNQDITTNVKLKRYEKIGHSFLSFLLKVVLWVVIPFILLIFILEEFDFSLLIFPAMVVFVYIPIFKQNENRLRIKLINQFDKHREELIKNNLEEYRSET